MKELKTGNIVDFLSIDEFSGKEVKLTGKVIGDYLAVRKQYPQECAEVPKDTYLVKVDGYSGLHIVGVNEILDTIKGVTNGTIKD